MSLMHSFTQTIPNVIKYVHILAPYKSSFDVLAIENVRNKKSSIGNIGKTMLVFYRIKIKYNYETNIWKNPSRIFSSAKK